MKSYETESGVKLEAKRRGIEHLGEKFPASQRSRLRRALGPLLIGLFVDVADLVSYGPVGLYAGGILGLVVGACLAKFLGFGGRGIVGAGMATAVYCTIPGTSFVPVASVLGVLASCLLDED